MLDMSVRAKILGLLDELKRDLGLTYVYITHDLASARFFCDRIAIMYLGKVIEIGPSRTPIPPAAWRATCRAVRSPTRCTRPLAARSIRAARRRSGPAGGRPATCG